MSASGLNWRALGLSVTVFFGDILIELSSEVELSFLSLNRKSFFVSISLVLLLVIVTSLTFPIVLPKVGLNFTLSFGISGKYAASYKKGLSKVNARISNVQ